MIVNGMLSPTGLGIRSDPEGDGNYGARRGLRRHNGIDFLCIEYQDIIAPFDMIIVREALPRLNATVSGIEWQRGKSKGKMFYFLPNPDLIGKPVKKHSVIGIAQSASKYYKLPNMDDHIHFGISK